MKGTIFKGRLRKKKNLQNCRTDLSPRTFLLSLIFEFLVKIIGFAATRTHGCLPDMLQHVDCRATKTAITGLTLKKEKERVGACVYCTVWQSVVKWIYIMEKK